MHEGDNVVEGRKVLIGDEGESHGMKTRLSYQYSINMYASVMGD